MKKIIKKNYDLTKAIDVAYLNTETEDANDIVGLITSYITKEEISNFLDLYLSEQNIKKVNNVLKFIIDNNIYEYYILIIFIIYFELASIDNILSKTTDLTLNSFKNFILNICINGLGITNSSQSIYKKEYFVRDYIKNLYTHRTSIAAYKDITNIQNNMVSIWELLTTEEKDLCSDLGCSVTNFYNFFIRINNQEALCEAIIQDLAYILNRENYTETPINLTSNLQSNYATRNILLSIFKKIMSGTIYYE